MSMVLELSEEVERTLRDTADRKGIPAEELARTIIEREFTFDWDDENDDAPGRMSARMSESAFNKFWDSPEDDEAWKHL